MVDDRWCCSAYSIRLCRHFCRRLSRCCRDRVIPNDRRWLEETENPVEDFQEPIIFQQRISDCWWAGKVHCTLKFRAENCDTQTQRKKHKVVENEMENFRQSIIKIIQKVAASSTKQKTRNKWNRLVKLSGPNTLLCQTDEPSPPPIAREKISFPKHEHWLTGFASCVLLIVREIFSSQVLWNLPFH